MSATRKRNCNMDPYLRIREFQEPSSRHQSRTWSSGCAQWSVFGRVDMIRSKLYRHPWPWCWPLETPMQDTLLLQCTKKYSWCVFD